MITATQMRRTGWTRRGLRRAMRALFALAEHRRTKDAALARELLRTIEDEHDLDRFLDIRPPQGSLVPDGLEAVVEALEAPGSAAEHLQRLEALCGDPVPPLIRLVADLTPRERSTRWIDFPSPQRAAIEALAGCHTLSAMTFLLRVLAWGGFEEWDRVAVALRDAGTDRVVGLTLTIWPRATAEVRSLLAGVLGDLGVRDERVLGRYRAWLDEASPRDARFAIDAVADLGDHDAGPAALRAFDRMVDDRPSEARQHLAALAHLGLTPTTEQQRRLDAAR